MNRKSKLKTIVMVVLLFGVASLMGSCKKGQYSNMTNGAKFTDEYKKAGNGFDHKMRVELDYIFDDGMSCLELDGTKIKSFYGCDSDWVTKNVPHGKHQVLCYTLGTMDTLVNVFFEQDKNGVFKWSTPNTTTEIHISKD
jgi:hypothetical protein